MHLLELKGERLKLPRRKRGESNGFVCECVYVYMRVCVWGRELDDTTVKFKVYPGTSRARC
eukprot:6190289-Pleurochrysis_carterae.AAC.1